MASSGRSPLPTIAPATGDASVEQAAAACDDPLLVAAAPPALHQTHSAFHRSSLPPSASDSAHGGGGGGGGAAAKEYSAVPLPPPSAVLLPQTVAPSLHETDESPLPGLSAAAAGSCKPPLTAGSNASASDSGSGSASGSHSASTSGGLPLFVPFTPGSRTSAGASQKKHHRRSPPLTAARDSSGGRRRSDDDLTEVGQVAERDRPLGSSEHVSLITLSIDSDAYSGRGGGGGGGSSGSSGGGGVRLLGSSSSSSGNGRRSGALRGGGGGGVNAARNIDGAFAAGCCSRRAVATAAASFADTADCFVFTSTASECELAARGPHRCGHLEIGTEQAGAAALPHGVAPRPPATSQTASGFYHHDDNNNNNPQQCGLVSGTMGDRDGGLSPTPVVTFCALPRFATTTAHRGNSGAHETFASNVSPMFSASGLLALIDTCDRPFIRSSRTCSDDDDRSVDRTEQEDVEDSEREMAVVARRGEMGRGAAATSMSMTDDERCLSNEGSGSNPPAAIEGGFCEMRVQQQGGGRGGSGNDRLSEASSDLHSVLSDLCVPKRRQSKSQLVQVPASGVEDAAAVPFDARVQMMPRWSSSTSPETPKDVAFVPPAPPLGPHPSAAERVSEDGEGTARPSIMVDPNVHSISFADGAALAASGGIASILVPRAATRNSFFTRTSLHRQQPRRIVAPRRRTSTTGDERELPRTLEDVGREELTVGGGGTHYTLDVAATTARHRHRLPYGNLDCHPQRAARRLSCSSSSSSSSDEKDEGGCENDDRCGGGGRRGKKRASGVGEWDDDGGNDSDVQDDQGEDDQEEDESNATALSCALLSRPDF